MNHFFSDLLLVMVFIKTIETQLIQKLLPESFVEEIVLFWGRLWKYLKHGLKTSLNASSLMRCSVEAWKISAEKNADDRNSFSGNYRLYQ